MNYYQRVRYEHIEQVVMSYIDGLYLFLNRDHHVEVEALQYALEKLKDVPGYIMGDEYESHVMRLLESLLANYQGNANDYGQGRGAIMAVTERVRCLFFSHKSNSSKVNYYQESKQEVLIVYPLKLSASLATPCPR